ncbi:MAG: hypothetical protein WB460_12310 [Candidatus Acidiferrales bacterium]
MPRQAHFVLLSALVLALSASTHGQEGRPTPANGLANEKTLIVATETKSDSVVAVPPITSSVVVNLRTEEKQSADAIDLPSWIAKEAALNGLQSADAPPWHVVVTYDQFDEDSDNVHSGVYEEYWAGEKKYKRIYKSDNFNQTDYATDKGLFRVGDQQWPDRAQSQVGSEVIAPFYYAATLQGFHGRSVERAFSGYELQCVFIEKNSGISAPTQYCFEPDSSVLRYTHGFGWFQTVYNRIESFQGRNIAREVDVTDAGKPYLKLRVETIESLSRVDDAIFLPPRDAVGPLGGRVSGVQLVPINMSSMPQWPASLRQQHFTVKLAIVVGKDGHVISAHATSGLPEGYKACENAVEKWVFKPYLVLDKPVEVEQQAECRNN